MNTTSPTERQSIGSKGNGSRWLSFLGSLAVTVLVFLWIGRDIEPMDVVDAITAMAPPEILLFFVSSLFMSEVRIVEKILVYLVGLLGGWLADRFGYEVVFSISAVSAFTATMIWTFWVKEPRTKETVAMNKNKKE